MSELPPTTTTPDTNGRLMRRVIDALGVRAVNLLRKLGDRFDNHSTQLDQNTASTTGPIDTDAVMAVRAGNPDMDLSQIYTAAAVANLIGRLLSGHEPTNHPRTGR